MRYTPFNFPARYTALRVAEKSEGRANGCVIDRHLQARACPCTACKSAVELVDVVKPKLGMLETTMIVINEQNMKRLAEK